MTYVLNRNAREEFERLEHQSTLPQYDYQRELALSGMYFDKEQSVLDAGTGSGIVARYIAREFGCEVTGCDLSKERIAEARKAARGIKGLKFETQDLSALTFPNNTFDVIVCRYVLEHIPNGGQDKVLNEFLRCLKPGGKLCAIDADGLISNVYPRTPLMGEVIKRAESSSRIDLFVGRKMPHLMAAAGFENVKPLIQTMDFSDEHARQCEIDMIQARFKAAFSSFVEVTGSEKEAQRFIDEYLQTLAQPGSTLFYNKFIVTGVKPKSVRMTLLK